MELNDDPEAPKYFEALIKYLEGAIPEDIFLKIQNEIRIILNEREDQMSRLLEGVLEDIIKKKLNETAAKSEHEGFKKGEEKGIKEGIKEIALKMISKNLDNGTISEITGLTIEAIERLRKR